jgi:branched-chain amino acid transport system permease protein
MRTRKAKLVAPAARVPVLIVLCLGLTFMLSDYDLYILTQVAALAIVVMGLNLLMGRLGSISAGHGALMGTGGYATALLVVKSDIPYGPALLLAMVLSAVAGLIVGLPAIRIRGLSLALVTLGLAIVFPELVSYFASLTGGQNGLPLASISAPAGVSLDGEQWLYLVTVSILFLSAVAFALITSSPFGRALDAVRVSEDLAASCGVAVGKTAVIAFAVSAAFAGLGGGLYQLALGTAAPDTYSFSLTLSLVFAAVIGGMRGSLGAIIGAAFIVFVPNYTSSLGTDGPQLVYACLILATVYGTRLFSTYRSRRRTAETTRAATRSSDCRSPVTASNK